MASPYAHHADQISPPRTSQNPRIAVVATGGTIASTAGPAGYSAQRRASELFSTVEDSRLEIETHDLMTVGSYRLTFTDMRVIADKVAEILARQEDPVTGIVVTHGTDTMEETAYLLDLIHHDSRPVILTGAQLPSDHEDSDGPANLSDSLRCAAAPECRNLGVLIVFAGEIFPARGTRKVHTRDFHAFGCENGPLGTISTQEISLTACLPRPEPLAHPTEKFDSTRVDLVMLYPGADDVFLRAAVLAGARGIILAGTGIGNTNPVVVDTAAELLTKNVALVLSSRVAHGPVRGIYGNGGGADLVALGIPAATDLPATQVRILVALWLSFHPAHPEQIRSLIGSYALSIEE